MEPSDESAWREVPREEFFRAIATQDIHPRPVGKYPYTSEFRTPAGQIRAKTVGYYPPGAGLPSTRYLLPS